MKVAIHNAARVWGGNEKWMEMLAAGLVRRGHRVVVCCRAGGEVERRCREAGLRTSPVRPGAPLDLVRAVRFAAWLRRERPDVLLLTSWTSTLQGAWAGRVAGVGRIVVRLGVVRSACPWHDAIPFRRWVDAMIVNAPEVRDAWRLVAPWFPAERVRLVLNGVPPRAVDRAAARVRLGAAVGATADAVLVGAAGHVAARKGFDLLLGALGGDPRLHAVVAGEGPELAALRARAAALGVAGRVSWLGRRDDVPDVLAGCDVFALPSRCEGMANVMLESMAAGTPVVATDIAGVRTALGACGRRPAAGWIVPPDDAPALGRALTAVADLLAGDPEVVRGRAAEASWRVEHRFGVERMVDEALGVLVPQRARRPVRARVSSRPRKCARPVPA